MSTSIVRTLAVLCLAGCVVAGQQNPRVPPAFRSAVTLVPVDVRVVKIIVYDYQADLLGSAEAMLK